MGVFDVDESSVCGVSCEDMNITDKKLFLTQNYHFPERMDQYDNKFNNDPVTTNWMSIVECA